MIGNLSETRDIASRLGVTLQMIDHIIGRKGIKPIARAGRTRLFASWQVQQIAEGLANRRPYKGSPRPEAVELAAKNDEDHSIPDDGHSSALGISLAAGTDEATVKHAIERAGITPHHFDEREGEPMYGAEDARRIVAIVASVGQVQGIAA